MPSPLSVSRGFRDFVLDQLQPLGSLLARPMFGGVGLYCGDLFFGILARDILYLKVDDRTRHRFEARGQKPFKPYADRPATMQYYPVPADVLEDAEELVRWARQAVQVVRRAASQRS